jgi:Mrp family chromosome partitioning ATPase
MSTLLAMTVKLIDERGSAIIHLTASGPGQGTTTVAREIAALAAQSSWCKVALIDAARPEGEPRPSPAGGDPADLDLQPARFGGSDMTVGLLNRSGQASLRIDTVRKHYAWLRANFSLIVVDCPPALSSSEAATIASLADGTIVVVEAEQTRVADVEKTRELLLQAGGVIFGVILNKRRQMPDYLSRLA